MEAINEPKNDIGNILSKTGLCAYTYGSAHPHAVTGVENTGYVIQSAAQHIDYNPWGKASRLPYANATDFDGVTGREYALAYNGAGALVSDEGRGMARVDYDLMGNPLRIQFTDGSVTRYIYSTAGEKLRVVHLTAVPNITVAMGQTRELAPSEILAADSTDYLLGGSLTMKNGRIDRFLFDEGYCQASKYAPNPAKDTFMFYYYDRDHLGSVRQVILANGTNKGTLVQKMDYYPSGLLFCDGNSDGDVQPVRFSGKELDRMHGLGTYDFGARQYNPVTMRWDRMDPLCEKYYGISPYAYCGGDPVNAVDPDGRRINYYNSADETWYTYYNGHFYRYGDIVFNRKTNIVTISGKPVNVSNQPNDYMTKTLNYLNQMASSKDEIIREVFTAAQENAKYDINIRRNLRDEREGSFTRGKSGHSVIFLDFEHDLKSGSDMRRNHGTEYDIFGHEFKHAYDNMYYLGSRQKYGRENFTIDEFYTVIFENRLRKDEGNRFMRNNYGRVPIPYQYRKFFMFNRNNRKRYEVK